MNSKDLKAKIEYYTITLSFTVLAVAIQTVGGKTTYKFEDEYFQCILKFFEFPSWALFAISGSLGIIKLFKISELLSLIECKPDTFDKDKIKLFYDKKNQITSTINIFHFFQYLSFFSAFLLMIISRIMSIV